MKTQPPTALRPSLITGRDSVGHPGPNSHGTAPNLWADGRQTILTSLWQLHTKIERLSVKFDGLSQKVDPMPVEVGHVHGQLEQMYLRVDRMKDLIAQNQAHHQQLHQEMEAQRSLLQEIKNLAEFDPTYSPIDDSPTAEDLALSDSPCEEGMTYSTPDHLVSPAEQRHQT